MRTSELSPCNINKIKIWYIFVISTVFEINNIVLLWDMINLPSWFIDGLVLV